MRPPMRPFRSHGWLPAAAAFAVLSLASPIAAQDIAIVGGTVHTVTGEPMEGGTVLIRGGRIASVGTEIYGMADRYGAIEPGRVANVVVWSGDPFELSTRAETVIVRGEIMPDWTRQKELLERYLSLENAPRPAYDVPGSR